MYARMIVLLIFPLLFPLEVFAECRKWGSSFSRNNQSCEKEQVTYSINNNYYFFSGSAQQHHRKPMRRHESRQTTETKRYSMVSDYAAMPNEILDRRYAPGFGTSLPFKGNYR